MLKIKKNPLRGQTTYAENSRVYTRTNYKYEVYIHIYT